ncbi:hypothetical protein FVER53590_09926 [Fusarium verticillioides]|nr:hypothetical protein FVER14953_09926 [Fusarium verticillioides]RBR20218.1 hypothetical protein FVER53590_09926 [Fusarium verticillioides]
METAPPQYNAEDAPPSYEDVVKKFTAALGNGKDPEKILDAMASLNLADCKVVCDKNGSKLGPIVGEKDMEKFQLGAEQAASLPVAQEHLKKVANTATRAVKDIEMVFNRLLLKIMEIDKIHESGFVPKLRHHQETFSDLIRESRLLAREISQHGQEFDELTVEFCADKTISVEERINRIEGFRKEAEGFETASVDMQKRFEKLNNDFTEFIGEFKAWAEDKEKELDKKLTQVIKEIGDLKIRISEVIVSLGFALAGTVIGAMIFAAGHSPFSFILIAAGLILCGLSGVAAMRFIATYLVLSNELKQKEKLKKEYESQLKMIQKARSELVSLGNEGLGTFWDKIGFLKGYWVRASSDAEAIEIWLKKGASDAKWPDYMKKSLHKNVKIYKALSTYLEEYSRGVDTDE